SYKKSPNHQVIRTPIFCSPTTVDEEPLIMLFIFASNPITWGIRPVCTVMIYPVDNRLFS
ncbi:hypothetical protein, partial [Levilactobacillus fujinensis]|uniref:hypothetical protein n=1 Tax=Levilactobacillus fujinensis TaxID=2486024 RepID=UPI001CDC4613